MWLWLCEWACKAKLCGSYMEKVWGGTPRFKRHTWHIRIKLYLLLNFYYGPWERRNVGCDLRVYHWYLFVSVFLLVFNHFLMAIHLLQENKNNLNPVIPPAKAASGVYVCVLYFFSRSPSLFLSSLLPSSIVYVGPLGTLWAHAAHVDIALFLFLALFPLGFKILGDHK